MNILSGCEQKILKQKLIDESEEIKTKFAELEMSTLMWLNSKSPCSPEQLKCNYALKPFNSVLKDASDYDSIFQILNSNNVWSWYSFEPLTRIIRVCSQDNSELLHKLNKYNKELEKYCRRSVFECPHLMASYEPRLHHCLFVKLADEDDDPSLKDLQNKFEPKLATIINVEPRDLVLLTYQGGCTQLIYSLPRAVAKKGFPLSQVQQEMLLKMGVLECYLFPDDPLDEVRKIY